MATLHNEDGSGARTCARRPRDRAARRRRDPAGRLARRRRRRARGPRPAHVPAGALPDLRPPTVRARAGCTRCLNPDCPAPLAGAAHFVSRGAMDIDGVGEKLMALLRSAGSCGGRRPLPADRRAAARARRLQQRSAERDRVDRGVARRPFGRVLFALGIPHVGGVTAATRAALPLARRAARRQGRSRSRRRPASGRRWPRRSPRSSPRRCR